jgi:hypothetical protein
MRCYAPGRAGVNGELLGATAVHVASLQSQQGA